MNHRTFFASILYIGILGFPLSLTRAEERSSDLALSGEEVPSLVPKATAGLIRMPRIISEDLFLSASEGPYVFSGLTDVYAGATLRIEPGTIVKGRGVFQVQGALIAGGAGDVPPVVFTSWDDDSAGGDMNDTGESDAIARLLHNCRVLNTPAQCVERLAALEASGGTELPSLAGEGPMIIAREGGVVSLQNVEMRYGGGNGWYLYENPPPGISGEQLATWSGQLANIGGFVDIKDSVFLHAPLNQIMQTGGETRVERTRFSDSVNGVRMRGGSFYLHDSSITSVRGYGFLEEGYAASAQRNWWGAKSGPSHATHNTGGQGAAVSENADVFPWLTEDPFAAPAACTEPCASNVLFLPGIKGSRLYSETGEKLWEPFGNGDIEAMMLDATGRSLSVGVRAADRDIVDTVAGIMDIYGSFAEFMDVMTEGEIIRAWIPFAYDWRLSLPDIVANASDNGQDLRASLEALADASKTGKVTIVAHSNGGLVAKELMRSMHEEDVRRLIDDVILIGVPQSGAPQALGALLYGYKEGLPWWFPGIVSTKAARAFAMNAPMGYHLLPSQQYLAAEAATHPIVRFREGEAYEIERATYGETIDTFAELTSFALAREGGRERPLPHRIDQAAILNHALLAYAASTHDALDAWEPPEGVGVYQIAGTGASTVSGIEYYEQCALALCASLYAPLFREDGDGVVPASSARMMQDSPGSETYAVDLSGQDPGLFGRKDHGTLLSMPEVQSLVAEVLTGTASSPSWHSLDERSSAGAADRRIMILLHAPLALTVTDENGNRASADEESIPGSAYGAFGGVQYIFVPRDAHYQLELEASEPGTFTLEIRDMESERVLSETVFLEVPVLGTTRASLAILPDAYEQILNIDTDGDGITDTRLIADTGEVAPRFPEDMAGSYVDTHRSRSGGAAVPQDSLEQLQRTLYRLLLQLFLLYLKDTHVRMLEA